MGMVGVSVGSASVMMRMMNVACVFMSVFPLGVGVGCRQA